MGPGCGAERFGPRRTGAGSTVPAVRCRAVDERWRRAREANRARWDESAPLHADSELYDLDGFRAGRDAIRPYEHVELGAVAGLDLLHLQCHIGTLSTTGRPAKVPCDLQECATKSNRIRSSLR